MSLFANLNDNGIVEAPVQEPVETDNQVVEQVVEPEEVVEVEAPVVKSPYTPEEIAEILGSDDANIDTDRLDAQGKLIWKSFQKGITPKLQEAAEIRKELDRIRTEFEAAKPKPQPKDIYEAYDQDPDGVMNYVNTAIKELAEDGTAQSIAKIEELRDLKEQFRERKLVSLQSQQTKQQEVVKVLAAITDAVPDISTKQVALRDFALNIMGMTQQELAEATDPMVSGMNAAIVVKRINHLYDQFNAGKTAKQKLVKPAPTVVEQPGHGYEPKQPTLTDKKRDAIASGNFRDFFMELGD